ncbi:hypothetical protein VCHA53O466_50346 [Vibrio chagasii]|nr:hypothetical protein VCHA53O466_50346 [Vibrio chagasii]
MSETQALSLVHTIAANVNSKSLSDSEFRDFVRTSLPLVEGVSEVISKFTDNLPKLRANNDVMPFSMQDESRYHSLVSCNSLLNFYPFCKGNSFHDDALLYNKLLSQHGLVSEGFDGKEAVQASK